MTGILPANLAGTPRRSPIRLPGGMSAARFMRDYWQRKPLLIRGALPSAEALLPPDQLFELAGGDDVESRLVQRRGDVWTLEHGPFDHLPPVPRASGPGPRHRSWTLLVQGVNLHSDRADALLRRFAFISQARLDDLMISYATDGGGVGPHVDSYDVFLLQTLGQRHWRVSAQADLELVEGMPLKILADFRPEQEWVLEPGDMLYLPPRYAHEGTAIGACMTCSIGFRAPAYDELAREFLVALAEDLEIPGRYSDPDRKPTKRPAHLDAHLIDALAQRLATIRWSRKDIADFLAGHLSEPKANVFFDAPDHTLSATQLRARALRKGVRLHRKTSMLYSDAGMFINGEAVARDMAAAYRTVLRQLADERDLQNHECVAWLDHADLLDLFTTWHSHGWLEIGA